jgi:hypothetical protein
MLIKNFIFLLSFLLNFFKEQLILSDFEEFD